MVEHHSASPTEQLLEEVAKSSRVGLNLRGQVQSHHILLTPERVTMPRYYGGCESVTNPKAPIGFLTGHSIRVVERKRESRLFQMQIKLLAAPTVGRLLRTWDIPGDRACRISALMLVPPSCPSICHTTDTKIPRRTILNLIVVPKRSVPGTSSATPCHYISDLLPLPEGQRT